MQEISYNLSRGPARIIVGKGSTKSLKELPKDILVVHPAAVSGIVDGVFIGRDVDRHIIKDGEAGKTLESVMEIVEKMHGLGFKRKSTIVSVGGGSTSDAVGMAASMYMRGINLVSVPTTLLSMIDASIGGKNAINFHGVKNLLGSFYSPSLTVIDTSFLGGAPKELITDGLGEMAKYALILDTELFHELRNVNMDDLFNDASTLDATVIRCVQDKMDIVAADEFDHLGERAILNFGHTMGHAIEGATEYGIGHGTAVAMGILLEIDLGIRFDFVKDELLNKASKLLSHMGLPHEIDRRYIAKISGKMAKLILSDKKAAKSSVRMPMLESIGKGKLCDVEMKYISEYLESFN